MGQGDGGRWPVTYLLNRFGAVNAAGWIAAGISPREIVRNVVTRNTIPSHESIVVLLDIVQTVEISANSREVQSGREMFDEDLCPRIMEFLSIPQVNMVVVCADCSRNENRAKEMCYYTNPPRRRMNLVPLGLPPGAIVLDDTHFPVGKWKSFKACEKARRQLNYYMANRFERAVHTLQSRFAGPGSFTGEKMVIFDNCIYETGQFSNAPRDSIKYHTRRFVFRNGERIGCAMEEPASCIAEGEYAMTSWVGKLTKENVARNFLCVSTDQDIVPLNLLSHAERKDENGRYRSRVFTIMPTIRGPRNGPKIKEITVFDINRLVTSIIMKHDAVYNNTHFPVMVEVFLFLLGGGDNVKKPLHGIGYKVMHKEFIDHLAEYAGMVSVIHMPAGSQDDNEEEVIARAHEGHVPDPHNFDVMLVDPAQFIEFAKAVRRCKKRSIKKAELDAFVASGKTTWAIKLRQIMYTVLFMRIVPWIRAFHDIAMTPDPFLQDAAGLSVWGYAEAMIPGGPGHPVLTSAGAVSPTFFADAQGLT